jgi:hypothetical protein
MKILSLALMESGTESDFATEHPIPVGIRSPRAHTP